MSAIVAAIYIRDPLAILPEVPQDFVALLTSQRDSTEAFKNYESRFQAKISSLNPHSSQAKLSHPVTAFVLLSNADVDTTQRIFVLETLLLAPENLQALRLLEIT